LGHFHVLRILKALKGGGAGQIVLEQADGPKMIASEYTSDLTLSTLGEEVEAYREVKMHRAVVLPGRPRARFWLSVFRVSNFLSIFRFMFQRFRFGLNLVLLKKYRDRPWVAQPTT
jgi:hypothetical protein